MLLAVPGAVAPAAAQPFPAPRPCPWLAVPRPGRAEAVPVLREGIALLREGRAEEARARLEGALRRDPNLVAAWVDLAAADIETCRRDHAIFAAMVARILDPSEVMAATNLRLASRLACPDEKERLTPAERAEAAIPAHQDDPAAWRRAAALRREAGDVLLAVFLEYRALEAGGDREAILRRAAADLAGVGLLRQAAALLAEVEDEEARARGKEMSRRVAAVEPRAAEIARRIAPRAGLSGDRETLGLARIAEVLLLRGADPADVEREVARLLGLGGPPELDAPFGRIRLPDGWMAIRAERGPGAPALVLRRFPGDTQVAFWPRPPIPAGGAVEEVLASRLVELAATPVGPPAACTGEGWPLPCRRVEIEADLGPAGRDRLVAFLLEPGDGGVGIVALALAGDAGLGEEGLAAAREAVAELVRGVRPVPPDRLRAWAATAGDAAWRWPHPPAWRPVRSWREAEDPWRTFAVGERYVVDLPPGVTAGRVLPGFRDRRCGPFTRLWFRGGFVDLDKHRVSIGAPGWAGHVDVRPGAGGLLDAAAADPARMAPAGDPGARLLGSADLGAALAAARTGSAGRVARFAGKEFPGTWFVAWVRLGADLVVVEEPVTEGERSLALLWIPVTVRPPDNPGPEPPVDVAARWRIRFLPTRGRGDRADPREGILLTGPLEVALPRGFRASMRASSPDGFPVIARSREGATLRIDRLAPSASADEGARRRLAEARLGGAPPGGWTVVRERRGMRVLGGTWPGRAAWLVLPPDPAGQSAFLLVLDGKQGIDRGIFTGWRRLVGSSLRLRRERRR